MEEKDVSVHDLATVEMYEELGDQFEIIVGRMLEKNPTFNENAPAVYSMRLRTLTRMLAGEVIFAAHELVLITRKEDRATPPSKEFGERVGPLLDFLFKWAQKEFLAAIAVRMGNAPIKDLWNKMEWGGEGRLN